MAAIPEAAANAARRKVASLNAKIAKLTKERDEALAWLTTQNMQMPKTAGGNLEQ